MELLPYTLYPSLPDNHQINPFLSDPGMISDKNKRIHTNKRIIQQCYNPARNRQRMRSLYNKVVTTPVKQSIDKTALATAFLDLEKFSLLKWSDYVEYG